MSNILYCSSCNCARPHKVSYGIRTRSFYLVCDACKSEHFWYAAPNEISMIDNLQHAAMLNNENISMPWGDD